MLWWFDDDPRLRAAAAAITNRGDSVFVRIAPWWAVARETRLGKMSVPLPRLSGAIARSFWRMLGVEVPHRVRLAGLPAHRRDRFDHLLIAQAIGQDMIPVTDDRPIPLYQVQWRAC